MSTSEFVTAEQVDAAASAIRIWMYRNDFDARQCASEVLNDFIKSIPSSMEFFWVIERLENGQSVGYWNGCNSRSFVTNIDAAIQFRRREDATPIKSSWHWKDTQITQHGYVRAGLLPQPAASERCVEFEYCPTCGGELDTGWECKKCGRDWREYVMADEFQRRMDAVVEAAVEWHQSGREGDNTWFDKSEALSAAVSSLLELRSASPADAAEGEPRCEFCEHPSAFFPAELEQGQWVHRGRDNEVEFCTATPHLCTECGEMKTSPECVVCSSRGIEAIERERQGKR